MYFASIFIFLFGPFFLLLKAQQMHIEPIVEQLQMQLSYMLNLTRTLNNLYFFHNLIVYRMQYPPLPDNSSMANINLEDDPAMHLARVIAEHGITIPSVEFIIDPWVDANNSAATPNLGNILTNNNLAIVVLHDAYIQNLKLMEFVSSSLGASLETKIVFMLHGYVLTDLTHEHRLRMLRLFFRWCWSKNILNAIMIYQIRRATSSENFGLEVYSYTPFPKPIKLLRLTSLPASKFFTDKTADLMGYHFKTPVLQDKPNVFKIIDRHTGEQAISGTAGLLYLEFVRKINATFVEIASDKVIYFRTNIDYSLNLLQKRAIDVGIHPYTFRIPRDGFGSYPITHTNTCVVVPVVPEIYRGYYIPYTFNAVIWIYLLFTFVLFIALNMCGNYRLYGRCHASIAFAITLSGMLNLPSSFTERSRGKNKLNNFCAYLIAACIKILLLTTGLIFTHLHVATLTSLLSTTMYGRQLETLEDLRAAHVSIMVQDHVAFFFQYVHVLPSTFKGNLVIADADTISWHQERLDTNYAYIVYQEEWKIMRRLQSNLWKPLFKVASKLCIPNLLLTFPMQFNSPFYKRLMEFILWTQASGLQEKWSDMVFSEIQHDSSSVAYVERRHHPVPITTEHLMLVWYIWVAGVMIALAAFLVERFFQRINIYY